MNFRQSLITFLLFVCSIVNLAAQCDVTLGAPILDNTSGSIDIVIEGAINDNLSDVNQGLCSVELFFEHESIRDVSINLESPAGQSVVLVGPATGAGGPTQFTYWGVEFISCANTAMPDLPILGDVFTTEDNWGIFGNYSGQYYPQQGCLEDFNTGNVNGIWTLNFTDVISFDVGAIDSIRLIFCDSTNIFCQECLSEGGTLQTLESDYCEGDPNLNLNITQEFNSEPPIELYSYNYLIVQDNEVVGVNDQSDLSNFNFGSYQICGLSSLTGQTDDLLDDVVGTNYDELLELFTDNDYCADLSTNCLPINIIEVPDTILRIDTICTGNVLIIDGTEYSETGEYVISFSQSFCDSVSILDLLVIDNQAIIDADSDEISCLDGDVLLDASSSITSNNTILSWFKVDGVLDPNIVNDQSIIVTEPGIYGLSLITDICSDTAYYEILNDESIPSFSFDLDTLTCNDPFITIDMTPSIPLTMVSWTGPVTSGNEDILVASSGTYYIEGVALNGCAGRDSVVVYENLNVPVPIFVSDTITCARDTATIFTVLPDSLSYAFTWEGPNIASESVNENSIKVTKDTIYTLRLQNLNNGCIEEYDHLIQIDTIRTNFIIESSEINCNISESEMVVIPALDNVDYVWEYEDQGFVGTGDTLLVNDDGQYQLITKTANGCIDTFNHTVVADTIIPILTVDDVEISCLLDSIQLITNTLETDLTYAWTGPGNFQSSVQSPYVSNPGVYRLQATDSSGCFFITRATVIIGAGLPDITFALSDTLDCNVDSISFIPSDTTNLRFEWQSSNQIVDTTAYTVEVGRGGIYSVVVTDTISGCDLIYDVRAPSDYQQPIPSVETFGIDCNNSMVILNTSFLMDIDSLKWTSDFGFTSTEQSPVVTEGGDYYLTAVGSNGCVYTETVTVSQDVQLPIITTDVPLLDCMSPEVNISFTSNVDTDILNIRLPNGDLIAGNEIIVSQPDTYMAIATSISGCVDSMEMIVFQDSIAPEVLLITNGQINCLDTSSTIIVDHQEIGLTYDWSGPAITSPLGLDSIIVEAEGNYSVTVTDTAQCVTILDIVIESFIDFPVVSASVDTINCTQDMAAISLEVPDDVISIIWEGPSMIENNITDIEVNVPGTYIASVTNDNNCETVQTVMVVQDTIAPIVNLSSTGIIDCNTDSVVLSVNSNLANSTFEWLDPNGQMVLNESLEAIEAGIYNLSVTAPNTCVVDTFIIVEIDTLAPTIDTGADLFFSCADGKIFLSIETTSNIISYDWEGPLGYTSDIEEPLAIAPGVYSVTVTNDLGCSNSAEISVFDDTEGPEIAVRDTFITCDLLAVPLPLESSETDVSFTWDAVGFNSELQNPETNVVGEYIVYAISNRNECVTVDTVNVTYIDTPPTFDFESSNIDCFTPETTLMALDVADDFSATWTDDNFNILSMDSLLVDAADSFYLIVVGANACADTAKVIVEQDFTQVDLQINLNEPFQCNNTEVTLEGGFLDSNELDDYSIAWSTTDGIIASGGDTFNADVSGEGIYVLTVTNAMNGCESVDSIEMVKDDQDLNAITIDSDDPNCIGDSDGSITVSNIDGGFGPYLYTLNGVSQSDSIFANLGLGDYVIEVTDSLGCSIDMNIELAEGLDFMVSAESETTIIVGDTINLNSVFNIPDDEIASITWSAHNTDYSCDNCFDPSVTPLINTYYTLAATSEGGCEDSSVVLIRVNRNPDIDVANVFAPGSENNGLFYIQQTRGIEKVLSMSIFDKWASRMFLAENVNPADPSAGWDGTFRGKDVNPGVYVVIVKLLLFSGEVVTYTGDITLLR